MQQQTKVLVTGAGGMVGSALCSLGAVGYARSVLDVCDLKALQAVLQSEAPDLVIHCAALTDVDACARDPRAHDINVRSAGWLAERVPTWFVSSNYVFSGPGPHGLLDPVAPVNAYGEQKAQAEALVLAAGGHVLRTGWVYGPGGRNFPSRLPALLRAGRVRALEGWPVQPTWAPDLAAALMGLPRGLTHAIGGQQTTWADFARACAEGLGLPASRVIGVSEVPGMGPRPKDARLKGRYLPGYSQRLGLLLGRR